MDKDTAMRYLRNVILERFPEGPNRKRWLAWLDEFSCADEILSALSSPEEDPSRPH